jgi:general secretion pathway protein C
MNPIFNELHLRRFNLLAWPLVIAWSISTIAGVFLSTASVEKFSSPFEPFFEIFHLGQKFGLSEYGEVTANSKTVTTTTLVPDTHRIKAIYRSQSDSFVSISDAKATTIVPLHGIYKNAFRLIGLNDTSAVFRGYGKTYRLRLGYDDNLSRQEVVTRSVSDPSKTGSVDNEWRTIAYQTIKEQMDDIQNIEKSIDVTPALTGSKVTGFRVNTITSTSVFAQLGILQGDVIQSINNKKLESYSDALAITSQLPRLRSIRITVLRNNLQKDIVYEITR